MEIWDGFKPHCNYKRLVFRHPDGSTQHRILVQKTDRKPSVLMEYLVNGWSLRVEESSTVQPRPNGGTVGIMRRQRQLWSMGWTTLKRSTSSCVIPRTMMPTAEEIGAGVHVLFWDYDTVHGYRLYEGLLADHEGNSPQHYRVSNLDGTSTLWVTSQFMLAMDTRNAQEEAA